MKKIEKRFEIFGALKFLLPSLFGIFLFLTPVFHQNNLSIPISILSKKVQFALRQSYWDLMLLLVMAISFTASCYVTIFKKSRKSQWLAMFDVNYLILLFRLISLLVAFFIFFDVGPDFLKSTSTGGEIYKNLLPLLMSIFLVAGLFLSLLLDFGLLEFFSSFLDKVMRPIFTLPGRASIDCLASWFGDGTIGVMITSKQYENGLYSAREAAVVGTTFSIVSLTFSFAVLEYLNLSEHFLLFFTTISLTGVLLAIIMPRIPPLSKKPNSYYKNVNNNDIDDLSLQEKDTNIFIRSFDKAVVSAKSQKGFFSYFKAAALNIMELIFSVLPMVLGCGTIALVVAEYTNVFSYLGYPFSIVLNLMSVPEPLLTGQALVVGFADMFLPAIMGVSIISEKSRFIVASMSVIQLIFMSETGVLLISSKIPVNFKDVTLIFLIRTLISLPLLVFIAHTFL